MLVLLPKIKNIFLSFPVSEEKGQKSHRGSVVHSNARKRNNTLCSLLLKPLKTFVHWWFLKMFPSRPTSYVNIFLFLQGVRQRSFQQLPENKSCRQNVCIYEYKIPFSSWDRSTHVPCVIIYQPHNCRSYSNVYTCKWDVCVWNRMEWYKTIWQVFILNWSFQNSNSQFHTLKNISEFCFPWPRQLMKHYMVRNFLIFNERHRF